MAVVPTPEQALPKIVAVGGTVEIDVDDLVDRLFVPTALERHLNGTAALLQDGLKLSVLDYRRFAPPIESIAEREANMEDVCERFDISAGVTRGLKALGFRSTALLALFDVRKYDMIAHLRQLVGHLSESDQIGLTNCVNALNGLPLEPLYSIKRLANSKTLLHPLQTRLGHLDLSYDNLKPTPTNNPPYAKHELKARATFRTTNRWSKLRGSRGLEYHVTPDSPVLPQTQVVFVPYLSDQMPFQPYLVSPTIQTSGFFSDSSYGDATTTPSSSSSNSLKEGFDRFDMEEFLDLQLDGGFFCPYLDCSRCMIQLDKPLRAHLREDHNGYDVEQKARPFYPCLEQPPQSHFFANWQRLGHMSCQVEYQLFSPDYFWWGPKVFIHDDIAFFLVIFKLQEPLIIEQVGGTKEEPRMVFYLQANVDDDTASRYAYNVELCPPKAGGPRKTVRFRGKVFGLRGLPMTIRPDATTDTQMIQKMVYFHHSHIVQHVNRSEMIKFNLGLYKVK